MLQVYIPYSLKHAGKWCDDWSYLINIYYDIVYTPDLCEIKCFQIGDQCKEFALYTWSATYV